MFLIVESLPPTMPRVMRVTVKETGDHLLVDFDPARLDFCVLGTRGEQIGVYFWDLEIGRWKRMYQ